MGGLANNIPVTFLPLRSPRRHRRDTAAGWVLFEGRDTLVCFRQYERRLALLWLLAAAPHC